jgi:hypothetical protein
MHVFPRLMGKTSQTDEAGSRGICESQIGGIHPAIARVLPLDYVVAGFVGQKIIAFGEDEKLLTRAGIICEISQISHLGCFAAVNPFAGRSIGERIGFG